MPCGDRTGPWGLGPRTGRAAGYCTGYNVPGYANSNFGRGFDFGRGQGRGFGRRFWGRGRGFGWRGVYPYLTPYGPEPYPDISTEYEKAYLEDLVRDFEEQIKTIRQRLQQLSKEKKEDAQ